MTKNNLLMAYIIIVCLGLNTYIVSCSESDYSIPPQDNSDTITGPDSDGNNSNGETKILKSGYQEDNFATIENEINLWSYILSGNTQISVGNLPSKIDLSDKFPPIGDQGDYSTCVAWSVGYYYMTYLRGVYLGLSQSQLGNAANQFSPKDIYESIPIADKGSKCEGTYFENAFQLAISRGAAFLKDVPYVNIDQCACDSISNLSKVSDFKLQYYRKINLNENDIKMYLAQGHPVSFGAYIGTKFKQYNGGVFSLSGKDINVEGHAMTICGYDDNKQAFKVANSWGTDWGENGYLWIDYQTLLNNKIFTIGYPFIAIGPTKQFTMDSNDEIVNTSGNWDLVPTGFTYEDLNDPELPQESADPTWVRLHYNAYNAGEEKIPASQDWCIALMYYNAYDATDCGFFMIDLYSDRYGQQGDMCPDWLEEYAINDYGDPEDIIGIHADNYSWTNIDIKGGQSLSKAVYGSSEPFYYDIHIPSNLNGDYYVILDVDAFNAVKETNEINNLIYYTAANGKPIHYKNGVATNLSISKRGIMDNNGLKASNSNAYTTQEITQMLVAMKKSGKFKQSAMDHLSKSAGKRNITQYKIGK